MKWCVWTLPTMRCPYITCQFLELLRGATVGGVGPSGLAAYPPLPVSVSRPMGVDYVGLQFALALALVPAIALQPPGPPFGGDSPLAKTFPGLPRMAAPVSGRFCTARGRRLQSGAWLWVNVLVQVASVATAGAGPSPGRACRTGGSGPAPSRARGSPDRQRPASS